MSDELEPLASELDDLFAGMTPREEFTDELWESLRGRPRKPGWQPQEWMAPLVAAAACLLLVGGIGVVMTSNSQPNREGSPSGQELFSGHQPMMGPMTGGGSAVAHQPAPLVPKSSDQAQDVLQMRGSSPAGEACHQPRILIDGASDPTIAPIPPPAPCPPPG